MKGQGEAINPKLNVDGERIRQRICHRCADRLRRGLHAARARQAVHGVPGAQGAAPQRAQRDDGSVAALSGQRAGFVPAERHRGRYAQATVPRRPNARVAPRANRRCNARSPADAARSRHRHAGRGRARRLEMLLGVDESLARIVNALRDLGALDNTVVIFTSDHGYFYGEHGLNEERRLAYEETARIPLIVRYPRVARPGATPAELVQIIDLAPTVLALTGVADTVPRQGRSLVPLLEGASVRGGRRFCSSTTRIRCFHGC